jgi:hypothetical protein
MNIKDIKKNILAEAEKLKKGTKQEKQVAQEIATALQKLKPQPKIDDPEERAESIHTIITGGGTRVSYRKRKQ